MAVISLTLQISGAIETTREPWKGIRAAPAEVDSILQDLGLLNGILDGIRNWYVGNVYYWLFFVVDADIYIQCKVALRQSGPCPNIFCPSRPWPVPETCSGYDRIFKRLTKGLYKKTDSDSIKNINEQAEDGWVSEAFRASQDDFVIGCQRRNLSLTVSSWVALWKQFIKSDLGKKVLSESWKSSLNSAQILKLSLLCSR
jgi:hypothetical protein